MLLKDFSAKNFLGRDGEFELLKDIASEARAGIACSIFLSGRRGVGKSEFMRHLYHYFFSQQNDAVPFYYSVRSAFVSLENFAREYLGSFLLQSLAFLKRDESMLYSGLYSLEDLQRIAGEMADPWAVHIIDTFFEISKSRDGAKLFSFAISTPYQSYTSTGLPVVVIATCNWESSYSRTRYERTISNIKEAKARGAAILALITEGDTEVRAMADHLVVLPHTIGMLSTILEAVPLQLLAYHMGVLRGCDVDQPRNLAKSVTVE